MGMFLFSLTNKKKIMWPEDYIQILKKGSLMINQSSLACDSPTRRGQKVHLFNTFSLGRSEKQGSDEGPLYTTELNCKKGRLCKKSHDILMNKQLGEIVLKFRAFSNKTSWRVSTIYIYIYISSKNHCLINS